MVMQCIAMNYDNQMVIRVPRRIYDEIEKEAHARQTTKSEIIRQIFHDRYGPGAQDEGIK